MFWQLCQQKLNNLEHFEDVTPATLSLPIKPILVSLAKRQARRQGGLLLPLLVFPQQRFCRGVRRPSDSRAATRAQTRVSENALHEYGPNFNMWLPHFFTIFFPGHLFNFYFSKFAFSNVCDFLTSQSSSDRNSATVITRATVVRP